MTTTTLYQGATAMSANLVDHDHVDALLTAGIAWSERPSTRVTWFDPAMTDDERWADATARGQAWGPAAVELADQYRRVLTRATAGRVGQVLLTENVRSVCHRYDEDELATELSEVGVYTFRPLPGVPDPVVVLKAIDGYTYQSCEHAGWENSEAQAIVTALQGAAIAHLPGYDGGPGWSIGAEHRDVFVKAGAR